MVGRKTVVVEGEFSRHRARRQHAERDGADDAAPKTRVRVRHARARARVGA